MGPPLHSLALSGELHDIEETMYEHFYYTKHEDVLKKMAAQVKVPENQEEEKKEESKDE